MMQRETVRGYAKINLHLDVKGRLVDGYHSMETVMQSVSLYDTVTVTLTDEPLFVASCDKEGVPTDEKNIAVRAAKLFAEKIGSQKGAHIHIEKNIPMAAGLAGGSADAAATLIAINRLYDMSLTTNELCELGACLGVDVPFCIVGGTKYADGKGEQLHPFPLMPNCILVVACGGEGVSTPWGYKLLDSRYGDFADASCYTPHTTDCLRAAMNSGSLGEIGSSLYNVFEEPVLAERPVAADIRQTMLSCGAVGAMMSGSGPSVFGLFLSEEMAKKAAETIQAKNCFATVCHPVFPGKDE